MKDLISIIIVNWNGKKWLKKCFDTLLEQTYQNFEIIFVDNNSSDDSLEFLEKNYKKYISESKIVIVKNNENSGFAGGNNLGYKDSNGEYILLLNNDTWVENDFLEKYIQNYKSSNLDILGVTEKKYDGNTNGNITNKIDFFGHPTYKRNFDKKDIIYNDLFFSCGVCLMCKKEIYMKTGGLDNNFFMYSEEVDWMWRARLYGLNIGQLSNLFIYHAGAGSTGIGLKYNVFLWRNENVLQMLLKNYLWYNLLWVLPIYLLQNIVEIIAFTIFGKFKIAYSYIEGWIFNIKNLKRTLKKRKEIQNKRVVSDLEIMKYMYKGFGKINHLINYFK